jgi:hypothetical protein
VILRNDPRLHLGLLPKSTVVQDFAGESWVDNGRRMGYDAAAHARALRTTMAAPIQPGPATAKPTVAAGIFAAMFVVSATAMVWSGYVLVHGEDAEAVYKGLPADCAWVVLVDEPARAAETWDAVARSSQLPAGMTQVAAEQRNLWRSLAETPGLDASKPWGLCGRPGGVVAALVARGQGGTVPGQAWLDRLQAHTWPVHDQPVQLQAPELLPDSAAWAIGQRTPATDRKPGQALRRDGDLIRVAWTFGPDAEDLLTRAAEDAKRHPLQKNESVRGAFERVGGGRLHLYLTPALVQAAGARLGATGQVRQGLAMATWFAAVLREDRQVVRVHAQLGAGQHGAAWLKERFDTTTLLDAAPLVDAQARLVALLRFAPKFLPLQTEIPGVTALDAVVQAHVAHSLAALAEVSTGQALVQVLPGPEVAQVPPWLVHVQVPAGVTIPPGLLDPHVASQRAGEFLVLARDPALAQTGAELVQGKRKSLQGNGLSEDQKRMLTDTQGLLLRPGMTLGPWQGPMQIEWLWLDTGLVAEAQVPVPPLQTR